MRGWRRSWGRPTSGSYLPEESLRAAFSGVGDQVITYCGGGVAASSNAFVLGLLGVEEVAVYDGSLYEWAADASLPLEMKPGLLRLAAASRKVLWTGISLLGRPRHFPTILEILRTD